MIWRGLNVSLSVMFLPHCVIRLGFTTSKVVPSFRRERLQALSETAAVSSVYVQWNSWESLLGLGFSLWEDYPFGLQFT
jgi:hypothetical protein